MSETEYNKGKLVPINLPGATLEERAEALCKNDFGWEMSPSHDSWLEVIEDYGYREVYVRGDTIYKIINKRLNDADDIFEASENDDNTIDYTTRFYNGGCSFNEALDEAFKQIEKNGE